MQKEISVGDIVCLNSGGPDMKVLSVTENEVTVRWGGEDTFPLPCVYRVEESSERLAG